jgi:flagellar biosynthesis chaperone FliJ
MKQIIKNLEKQLEKLREFIQEREDKVDGMSEKWQESEKCEEFMDKTMEIEEQANELDTVICNLQELL